MNSDRDTLAGGLPHSEIPGSPIARISPGLFAACHVLHRLSVPRHPPDALSLRLSATPSGKKPLSTRHGNSTKILSRNTRTASRDARGDVPRLGHFTTRYSQCHQINTPPHPKKGRRNLCPAERSI